LLLMDLASNAVEAQRHPIDRSVVKIDVVGSDFAWTAASPVSCSVSVCLSACRGLGSVVGPLLAARALPLRCAASASANFYTGYA
jgi:hypothetical protein